MWLSCVIFGLTKVCGQWIYYLLKRFIDCQCPLLHFLLKKFPSNKLNSLTKTWLTVKLISIGAVFHSSLPSSPLSQPPAPPVSLKYVSISPRVSLPTLFPLSPLYLCHFLQTPVCSVCFTRWSTFSDLFLLDHSQRQRAAFQTVRDDEPGITLPPYSLKELSAISALLQHFLFIFFPSLPLHTPIGKSFFGTLDPMSLTTHRYKYAHFLQCNKVRLRQSVCVNLLVHMGEVASSQGNININVTVCTSSPLCVKSRWVCVCLCASSVKVELLDTWKLHYVINGSINVGGYQIGVGFGGPPGEGRNVI